MGFASLVCTYLYGAFAAVKAAIESYIRVAKNLLKKIDSLLTTLMTTVTQVINSTMRTIINLVKQYEKELFDILYNTIFGEDKTFWCSKLWKCVALFSELLDSNSWLNGMMRRWLNRKCVDKSGANNIMDLIKQSIDNFTVFQQTVCNAGFTVEFGISYIKKLFEWCSNTINEYISFLDRNIRRLKLMAESYLNTVIDWGIIEYLEKLLSFVMCAFDDSASCAEIATASNFYQDAMSKMKLQKVGDGYDLSNEYKNMLYGSLEGVREQCINIREEIDSAYAKCIDPNKLRTANAAYNLSKNIFPGGMTISDIRAGNWKNNHIVKKFNLTKDGFIAAWRNYQNANNDLSETTFKELINDTYIDLNGDVYIKNKCDYLLLNKYIPTTEVISPQEEDILLSLPADNDVILWNDKIISVTEAAVIIATSKDPEDQPMIDECRALYEFINDWKRNPSGVIKYE